MNKELEALLIRAAKATGRGVLGPTPERAAEFGVDVAKLVREGELIPGTKIVCHKTGYYTPGGKTSLCIEANSPGEGWTRYSVYEVRPDSTGRYNFGYSGVMTLGECKTYLRGVIDGAERILP